MLDRLVARHRLSGRVGIWYHPEYAPGGERILIELVEEGLLSGRDVRRAPIASTGDLLRFHPLSYLEASADRDRLAGIFNLRPEQVDVDQLLRAQRREVGGTVEAALAAVRSGSMCAINLGGGFHQAEPEVGRGGNVYNDVGIAIAKLRAQGFDRTIAIVDAEQGIGNAVAYKRDPTVVIFSIEQLPGSLRKLSPRLIFYIASEALLEHDVLVLDLALEMKTPLVVTRPSAALIRYALTGDRRYEPAPRRDLRADFSRIAREIDPMDLVDESVDLTDEELVAALDRRSIASRILGYYSTEGVEFALERYGILPEIRKRGWAELTLEIDPSDASHQLLRLRGRKRAESPMFTLVELVLSRGFIDLLSGDRCETLHIEWMLLEDPSKTFTLAKPPLPGQKRPGLGIAREMQELLVQAARRLDLAAITDNPAHYHNAFATRFEFFFLDPKIEGRFRAMVDALEGIAISDASFLVEEGKLRNADDTVCAWSPALHVLPIGERTQAYFGSDLYRSAVEAAKKEHAGLKITSDV